MLIGFVILYLVLSIGIGMYAATRVHNARDYVVARRHLPIYIVTATVFATGFGSETVLGVPAPFLNEGLRGHWLGLAVWLPIEIWAPEGTALLPPQFAGFWASVIGMLAGSLSGLPVKPHPAEKSSRAPPNAEGPGRRKILHFPTHRNVFVRLPTFTLLFLYGFIPKNAPGTNAAFAPDN